MQPDYHFKHVASERMRRVLLCKQIDVDELEWAVDEIMRHAVNDSMGGVEYVSEIRTAKQRLARAITARDALRRGAYLEVLANLQLFWRI